SPRLQPAGPPLRRLPGPAHRRDLRRPGRPPPRRSRPGRRHGCPRPPSYAAGTAPLQPPTGSPRVTEPNAPDKQPFLYVVVCACGIAGDVGKLITAAQERHWDVGVIATPSGLGFLDADAIEAQTGYPIRSAWRTPGEARPLPPADAIA